MAFSLSQAMSGAGQGIAEVAGENIKHMNTVDLEAIRAQVQAERDARLHDYAKDTLAYSEQLKQQHFKPIAEAMDQTAATPVKESWAGEGGALTNETSRKATETEVFASGLKAALKIGHVEAAKMLKELMQPKTHLQGRDQALVDETGKVLNPPAGRTPEEIDFYKANAEHARDAGRASLMQGRAALQNAGSLATQRTQMGNSRVEKMDEIDKEMLRGLLTDMRDKQKAVTGKDMATLSPDEQSARRLDALQSRLQYNRHLVDKGYREGDPYSMSGLPDVTKAMENVIGFLNTDPDKAKLAKRRSQLEAIYGDDGAPIYDLLDTYDNQIFSKPAPKGPNTNSRGQTGRGQSGRTGTPGASGKF